MKNNKIKKYIFILASLCLMSFSFAASANFLTNDGKKGMLDNMEKTGDGADFNTSGGENGDFLISDITSTIVKAFLGVLGIIFLIMILIGGFNWMTAAGNDTKVTSAKATLFRGAIGLLIIISAYIITAFVFRALSGAVGAPG